MCVMQCVYTARLLHAALPVELPGPSENVPATSCCYTPTASSFEVRMLLRPSPLAVAVGLLYFTGWHRQESYDSCSRAAEWC